MGYRIRDLQGAVTPLTGNELLELEQGGNSRQVRLLDLLPGFDNTLGSDLANSTDPAKGAALVGHKGRKQSEKNDDVPGVRDYGTSKVDGTTSNQDMVVAAAAANQGGACLVPAGTYVLTDNVPGFHNVDWQGPGVFKRGTDVFRCRQRGGQLNKLYVSPSGAAGNDGLTADFPLAGIQAAVDAMGVRNRLEGRWQVIGTGGSYAESVTIPDGLAQDANYLEFKFPSLPGEQGDPMSWPAGGAILEGAGLDVGTGFAVGSYNKVYLEYLLVRNFYDTGVANTQQVRRAVTVDKNSFLFTKGVSYSGNGIANLSVLPGGNAYVTGGKLDGSRFGIDNTGGRLSLTATEANYTTIRNALEYGLYQKHESSTVLDYTLFEDNGKHALAASYGAALFAYKANASIDTRGCKFNRNNIVYNLRGGTISTHPSLVDVMGQGADANGRIWLRKGGGSDDLLGYKANTPLDMAQAFSGTTASTSAATIVDNVCTIPAAYFTNADQYMEIEIHGVANGGTANVRPTFTSNTPANFAFGVFAVATNTRFVIKLIVRPTGASAQSLLYNNVNANVSGNLLGKSVSSGPFGASPMVFKVRGEITAGTLDIDHVSVKLWG